MSANDPAAPSGQGRPMSAEPIEGCKYCGKPGWKAVGGGYICSACASSPAPTSPAVPSGLDAIKESVRPHLVRLIRAYQADGVADRAGRMSDTSLTDIAECDAAEGAVYDAIVRLAALRAAQPGEVGLNELAERILLATDRLVIGDDGKRYGPKILALLRESLHAAPSPTDASTEAHEVARLMDSMEYAFTILANAYGGDWQLAHPDWQEAAARWRDEHWHPALDRNGYHRPAGVVEPPPSDASTEARRIEGWAGQINDERWDFDWSETEGYVRATLLIHDAPPPASEPVE